MWAALGAGVEFGRGRQARAFLFYFFQCEVKGLTPMMNVLLKFRIVEENAISHRRGGKSVDALRIHFLADEAIGMPDLSLRRRGAAFGRLHQYISTSLPIIMPQG